MSHPDSLALSNRFVQRRFSLDANGYHTVTFENRLSGQNYQLDSDEFLIEIDPTPKPRNDFGLEQTYDTLRTPRTSAVCLTRRDFALESHRLEGNRLRVELKNQQYGLHVALDYELADDAPVLRKRLTVAGSDAVVGLYVTRIEVERFRFEHPVSLDQPTFHIHPQSVGDVWYGEPALGQPLLGEDLFLGLEHPVGYNRHEDGRVALRHFPGKRLDQPVVSQPAVIGASERGHTCAAFRDYLMTIATPAVRQRRVILGFSSWAASNSGAHERTCLDQIERLQQHLVGKNNLPLDYYEIDMGWCDADTVWEVDDRKFPRGFEPLVDKLRQTNMRLGLWYTTPGHTVNPELGLEVSQSQEKPPGYCLAGPKYHAALQSRLVDQVRRYNLRLAIFDFWSGFCESEGHGHLPGRPYALEAITDAYIALVQAMRQAADDLFVINWEAGLYAYSPWWLMHIDASWMGFSDSPFATGVPSPLPQAINCITARDDMVFFETRRLTAQGRLDPPPYPLWATDTFAHWDAHEPLHEVGMPRHYGLRSDTAMVGLSRGSNFWNMWILPDQYTDADYAFLASAWNWGLRNKDLLLDMKPLFGEPICRQVYAYGHYSREHEKGIVTVRNPFIEQQVADIHLDSQLGLDPADNRDYAVRIVYPYHACLERTYRVGECVRLPVEGYQTLTLEIVPVERLGGPVVCGCRYEVTDDRRLRVWGRPGTQQRLTVLAPDGQTRAVQAAFPGSFHDLNLRSATIRDSGRSTFVDLNIPSTFTDPYLLVLFESETPEQVYCRIDHYDDQPGSITKPITQRSALDPTFQGNPHNMPHPSFWTFYLCPMTPGDHRLQVQLMSIEKNRFSRGQYALPLRGKLSIWLWAQQPLASTIIEEPQPFDAEPAGPIPLALKFEQRADCLVPPTYVNSKALNRPIVLRR